MDTSANYGYDSAAEAQRVAGFIETIRAKNELRAGIDSVSDTKTREGVLADVLAYQINALAAAAVAMSKAQSLAEARAAFADLANIGQQLLDLQASGALVFPYRAKKLDGAGILADLVRVSNGVSGALVQAAGT